MDFEKNRDVKESMTKSVKFFSWIQSFTKKMVSVTFALFVVIQMTSLVLISIQLSRGEGLTYLDTFLTESNETFRVVIGGYIIKAACENAIKISSTIIETVLDKKLKSVTIETPVEEETKPEDIDISDAG